MSAYQTINVTQIINGEEKNYAVEGVDFSIADADEGSSSAYTPRVWTVENHREEAIWINTHYSIFEWTERSILPNRWEEESVPESFSDENGQLVEDIEVIEPGQRREFSIYIGETDLTELLVWNSPVYATYHIAFDFGVMDSEDDYIPEEEVKIQFTMTTDFSN